MSSVRREQEDKSGAQKMKNKVIVVFPTGARNKGKRNRKSKLREITEKLKQNRMRECVERESVLRPPMDTIDPWTLQKGNERDA